MSGLLQQAIVYLLAAVVFVPIAKRLGLGSVIGYLVAGALIGPFAFDLVGKGEAIMHFAEFGVVMMLFLIGLELEPAKLWKLRRSLFGLGLAQVLVTAAVIGGIALATGLAWKMALATGLVLAMSSTAIVFQTLREKGLMKTPAGESGFSVLLFQDIAVIPILIVIPLLATLAPGGAEGTGHAPGMGLHGAAAWQRGLLIVAAVGGIVVGGRYLVRPVFRYIAGTRLREIFTAFALLLVLAVAELMQVVGLSAALGTFLAGVLLADSEYRPQLEADIEPFKGLLLGLFFMTVGAQIDFEYVTTHGALIAGVVAALLLVKAVVLFGLGRVFGLRTSENLRFALLLSQGGEFAFVLLAFSLQQGVLPAGVVTPLIAAVALSMAMTPVLLLLYERLIQPRFAGVKHRAADEFTEYDTEVLIAGFGRFGNVVGRILRGSTVHTTVLDHDADWVETLRKFGLRTYYGDATREDLLRKAGAESARIVVIALDDMTASLQLVDTIQREFPRLEIFARAVDRIHGYELMKRGVTHIFAETLGSSIDLTREVMVALGFLPEHADRTVALFRKHDEQSMKETVQFRDDHAAYVSTARQHIENLEKLLRGDLETATTPSVEPRPDRP